VRVKFEIFFLPCSPLFLSVRTEEEERLIYLGFQNLFFFFFFGQEAFLVGISLFFFGFGWTSSWSSSSSSLSQGCFLAH